MDIEAVETSTPSPSKPSRPQVRLLSARMSKFVASYQLTGNATQSAINAGYSATNARIEGFRLLRNPKIVAELETWKAHKLKMQFSKEDFVDYALKDYKETPLCEANRPRFLELAAKGAGIIGGEKDHKPSQTLNLTQITINGGEGQLDLWNMTRKMLESQ